MFCEISALKLQINLYINVLMFVKYIFIKTTRKTPTCEKEKKANAMENLQKQNQDMDKHKKNCILYTYRIWSACKWENFSYHEVINIHSKVLFKRFNENV